jgi:hypothetical protein
VPSTAWSKDLRVTPDGSGVVSHVGTALLRMLGDPVWCRLETAHRHRDLFTFG